MSWSAKYVGLPQLDHGRDRDGVDCWGLMQLVYWEQLSIRLPSYDGLYVSPDEHEEVARIVNDVEARGAWFPVNHIEPFDLLLFRRGQYRCHVGCALDGKRMLHVQGSDGAKLEMFREGRWKHRFTGAFRHVERGLK